MSVNELYSKVSPFRRDRYLFPPGTEYCFFGCELGENSIGSVYSVPHEPNSLLFLEHCEWLLTRPYVPTLR